ncbi:hypothetical protein [Mesorhizobium sp.]|uniref:hypothetical protein n=1 Tax=Mesorhizobium sp. TaxID=1871066 RepID=UPI0025C6BEA3|nr:hypothetical protein [Mesorhizobium sp.]
MKRFAPLAAVVLLLVASSAVRAEDAQPFVTNKDIDLTMILPPPPANDSAETKAELGEVLILQVTRTPEMEKRAIADAGEDVWRFADVMGPKFSKETAAEVQRLLRPRGGDRRRGRREAAASASAQ